MALSGRSVKLLSRAPALATPPSSFPRMAARTPLARSGPRISMTARINDNSSLTSSVLSSSRVLMSLLMLADLSRVLTLALGVDFTLRLRPFLSALFLEVSSAAAFALSTFPSSASFSSSITASTITPSSSSTPSYSPASGSSSPTSTSILFISSLMTLSVRSCCTALMLDTIPPPTLSSSFSARSRSVFSAGVSSEREESTARSSARSKFCSLKVAAARALERVAEVSEYE
mmetsp:Transcript_6844/g.20410  ORF Transcript_6844/g.20410 Transcript_6844/m.20410 type:complete len:232 (+) Transcript_6844:1046-1741(+)